jgi:hypothetical protein
VADPNDKRVPEVARACLAALGTQLIRFKEQILAFDRLIMASHRSNQTSKRLHYIPGVGPMLAPAIVARGMTATSGRQLRSCEGRMEIYQATTPKKQHDGQRGHATLAREPERPDCERREGGRQPNAHTGPRQIRIVDHQGGQARGTARHKRPATAISQPKGLEKSLRNELIVSPAICTRERRLASPTARAPRRVLC